MVNGFLPGLKLGEAFYVEVVRPLLNENFPLLPHAAALIGSGSEILGFDDEMSTDHHYGPRVMLFLRDDVDPALAEAIWQMLAARLPYRFRGYPTNFTAPNPNDKGVQLLAAVESGPVNHRVEILTLQSFFTSYLGVEYDAPLAPDEWLTLPQQRLCTTVGGAVYHDDIGLEAARRRFTWYPHAVWLYLLAAGWARIGQEEHLMGRAGSAGDEIGSALIGARLVRDVMRLCFLMERTYAPYPKWFGTAFRRLACGPQLEPVLLHALHAQSWQQREAYLVAAYEMVAHLHNQLGLTQPMPERAREFFGRPFRVMALHGFADALISAITDQTVQTIAKRPLIGNVDLVSDNTDVLENHCWQPILRTLYRP